MALPRKTLVIAAAFLAVYLIWGSTYLGIKYAVETMPPFLMASARWLIAGGALLAWRLLAGDERPTARQWLSASIVGALLIVGGNGTVSWAQQYVPSGLTALLIAVVPVFFAILLWARTRERPTARVSLGILLGLAGVGVLMAPTLLAAEPSGSRLVLGTFLILAAGFSWANGSLYSRTAPLPKSILLAAAMEMVAGGAILGVIGLGMGEAGRVDFAAFALRSWLAFGFLVVFGSVVAYSAYVWLLTQVRPELVATYAFVNPIVAVLLGTFVAGETLTALALVAAALIVTGVAIVVTGARRPPAAPAAPVAKPDA